MSDRRLRLAELRLILPREHGAWAMLLIPLLVGLGVAGRLDAPGLLFAGAALALFLARYPMTCMMKRPRLRRERAWWGWTLVYLLLAGGFTLPLLSRYGRWGLVAIVGVAGLLMIAYLVGVARRAEMTVGGEWLGIAGLTLAAPGAYYAATSALDRTALLLWPINLLYFGGTVFYIKLKVREQPRRPAPEGLWQKLVHGRATILYHLFAIGVVLALASLGWVPALVPVAFAPCLAKALRGALTWGGRPHMVRLGLIEVFHAVAFGLLLLLAYRQPWAP
ncbi:MAG: YwiC-like family protein [Anaerolineae bacterium]